MRLSDALRLSPGQTVAFVGAGGKSSAMHRLARELSGRVPVVITCTTRLGLEQSGLGEVHFCVGRRESVPELRMLLAENASALLTGPLDAGERKWTGLANEVLHGVHSAAAAAGAVMLVEADGARGRSVKAPAAHEPVVPQFANTVVPVVGVDAIGARINSALVHRPQRVAALLGLSVNARLEPEHLARILTHLEGGMKGIPSGVEVRALINKADDEELTRLGVQVAEAAVRSGALRAAAVASLLDEAPVRQVVGRVAGVVLAAGGSRRLASPKQLVPWKGRPLVSHAVGAALEGGLHPVVVVVGAEAESVAAAIAEDAVRVVRNPDWHEGQSTSLRAGLEAVEGTAEGVVFLLVDTPRVDGRLVRALVEAHRRTLAPVVAPRAGGRWANPVLFDRVTFAALARLEGDRGGRALFDRYPIQGVEWSDDILVDVDTPEDVERLRRLE